MKMHEQDIANLVKGHMENNRHDEALPILLRVLSEFPNVVWALTALGMIYRGRKQFHAAEACYKRAVKYAPDYAELHSNLGNLYKDMDRLDEAVDHSRKAVSLAPDRYTFLNNLAINYRENMQIEESLKTYEKCLELRPDDPVVQSDIGFVNLYSRDLDTAWDLFESRLKTDQVPFPDQLSIPKWEGQTDTKDKKLVVMTEQGFGDTLLMSRFFPLLAKKFKEVHVTCKPPLRPLFKDMPVTLINHEVVPLKEYDYYTPVMSIIQYIEKDWLKWPAIPPLNVAPKSTHKYRFLDVHVKAPKIGIVWSGSVTFKNNAKRAVDLEPFLKLAASHPDLQFYSFQKGEREQDLNKHGQGTIIPIGQSFDTFSDTAAALKHMDLIIMTDSALAHLAGAFDIPVLNLLNTRPYWLYLPKSKTTPLYPSMRFVHQEISGEWNPVFVTVDEILAAYSQKPESNVLSLIDQKL